MSAISTSLILRAPGGFSSGRACDSLSNQFLGGACHTNLSFSSNHAGKQQRLCSSRQLKVEAAYSEEGRPNSASIFVGGFVLGGIVVGALGCVFAPQISKALAATETDRKDLMRKLPKFIYDEEKALEKTRKVLTEKIAQLNSAIDEVSAQLRSEDSPEDISMDPDEVEAAL